MLFISLKKGGYMSSKMDFVKSHFEEEASYYDDNIQKLIPYYNEMIMALISVLPFNENDSITVLDLGCGTGSLSHKIKDIFPNAKFTIVDISEKMLGIAVNKIKPENIVQTCNSDFYEFIFPEKYDVIVSSLALHHMITDDDKIKFYSKIFDSLKAGGAFYNADVVLGQNKHLNDKYMQHWIEYMSRSCSQDEINNKWLVSYEKEDRPSRLVNQLEWLSEIGFKDVDIVWKYFNFAVYGGLKK